MEPEARGAWGRLVRAGFERTLRRADRRLGVPVWRRTARGGLCPSALVIALLAVAAMPATGMAAPGASPDPDPAPTGSSSTPAPDPYRSEQRSQPRTGPVTQQPAPTSSGGSATVSTPVQTNPTPAVVERRQKPAAATPRTRTKPKKKETNEVAARRSAPQQPTRQSSKRKPAVLAAASVDGGPLLLGGLALAALALASGSLLFLVSRSSGLEARS